MLENALRLGGVALIRDSAGLPAAFRRGTPPAPARSSGPEGPKPDTACRWVPLQYVSAPTILKLIDSFVTKPGMARADAARNMILIQGSGSERSGAVELVLSFDADWMKGQSVGIFPIENSNPEPIIVELEKILDSGEGGISQNTVKFQPIGRMNAVLAVTRKPEFCARGSLDSSPRQCGYRPHPPFTSTTSSMAKTRQMAQVLNSILVGGGGSGGIGDSAAGQIAPGLRHGVQFERLVRA